MNKITTYEELLQEKERLQLQLELQKSTVRMHVEEIEQKLQPVKNIVRFISNFTSPPANNTLFTTGLGLSLELLIRKLFFSKTGWITRMFGPILLKNFSTNMIKKNKDSFINKVKSLLHVNGKGS
jgi:hypothetical protein